jgi:hypothetical protein
MRVEINLLFTEYMDLDNDAYGLMDKVGRFQSEMLERIPIYRFGNSECDTDELIGCLSPHMTRDVGVDAFYFGQISKVDRVRQAELNATYTMTMAI